MPTRGFAAWHAVTMTIVSPERTMTAPSACLASLPVSMEIERWPSAIVRRCAVGMMDMGTQVRISFSTERRGACPRPAPAGITGVLLADAKLADELAVSIGVLALQVVEQPAALTDQLEQAAPRVMVF